MVVLSDCMTIILQCMQVCQNKCKADIENLVPSRAVTSSDDVMTLNTTHNFWEEDAVWLVGYKALSALFGICRKQVVGFERAENCVYWAISVAVVGPDLPFRFDRLVRLVCLNSIEGTLACKPLGKRRGVEVCQRRVCKFNLSSNRTFPFEGYFKTIVSAL